ncbi:PAS domain-containing hybrid sensor histidine kinase/response regulator [Usitatibacter palustris]|uniref:histidine kinase n=1 Tax=Usitatibacter palustris TaxID=2732487 RepID=A0A6M4H6H4_9PROT|nr:PAS domain S-box protein [Usitatibacter palustris]QJR15120.1 Sensor histidine kinase RcsC [Usitatibacter palustris]
MDRDNEGVTPRELTRDGEAYRFLMSETEEAVYFYTDTIEDCNEATCRLYELPREQLIGHSPLEWSPTLQADGALSAVLGTERFKRAFAGETQWFRWHYRKGDGRTSEAIVHIELVRVDGRRRLLVRARDLLVLERADHAIAETETRFQQILDHTPVIAFVKDVAGRYVFINREHERLLKRPRAEVIGHAPEDIYPPAVAQALRLNDQRVLSEGHAIEFEESVPVGDELRTYLSVKFPIVDRSGTAVAVGSISTDITARKHADEALRSAAIAVSTAEGDRIFEDLVRSMAAVLAVDVVFIAVPSTHTPGRMRTLAVIANGKIVDNVEYTLANTPCADVFGHEFLMIESGLERKYGGEPLFPGLRSAGYAGFPLVDAAGRSLGLISLLSSVPLKDPALIESMTKIYAVRAAAEIERSRSQAALRASEASHRAIFESTEDAIFVHDYETGAIVDVNAKACSAYGYSREEMLNVSIADLSSGKGPYTGENALRHVERAKTGEVQRFEWRRRNKDGSLHWDEVVLKKTAINGVPRILAFSREITARKLAEEGMRQAQKMEAIGHLTGGIAHDFNNILASIMGNIVLATDRETTAGDARLTRYLDQAMLAAKKARDLIGQMLTYSRGRRGQPRPFALGSLLRQSSQLLRSSLPATIDYTTQIADDVPPALIDPVQMEQVVFNLCINARDAMRSNGAIRAGVLFAGPIQAHCASCRQPFAGEFIELFVADSGPGIDPAVIERIFEPFFTTKEVGKGSGMGLSTVHGIVHEHGGHVVIETGLDQGTRFRVFVPPLAGGGAAAMDQTMPGFAPRRLPKTRLEGHVLVVDDEPAVVEVMRDLLEGWGLKVTVAPDGRGALALFSAEPGDFDLILTDHTMPRMTGIELAREATKLRPKLPIIMCTGYGGDVPLAKSTEAGIIARLAKPVEPEELLLALTLHLPDHR